jgi:hypothetical protein
MQVEHIGGGIVLLLVGELLRRPVRALLLLRQIDAEKLGAQVLEPVAVGVGARQLGGDLGAVDGPVVTPSCCVNTAISKRAKWKILTIAESANRAFRRGADQSLPSNWTRWAVLSPAESWARQSRSRRGLRPSVSVSMATDPLKVRPAGKSFLCSLMVGLTCGHLMLRGLSFHQLPPQGN